MLAAMRAQIQQALYAVPARRRPALRRTDAPDALLATDLPLVAGEEDVAAFIEAIGRWGWRVTPREGWLQLDADVPVPMSDVPKDLPGEAGCCISLLLRHPGADCPAALIRSVVKAADAGKQPFERLCGKLHADMAAALRRHDALPGGLLRYLCQACSDLNG